MNKIRILLFPLFVICLTSVALAQVWQPALFTFADTDPSSTSSGSSAGITYRFLGDRAGTYAESQVDFDYLKAVIQLANDATPGVYGAGALIQDRTTVTPDDPAYLNQTGTLRLSYHVDGTLSAGTQFLFGGLSYEYYAAGNSWSGSYVPYTADIFGYDPSHQQSPSYLTYVPTVPIVVDGTISLLFPITFGEPLNFSVGLSLDAYAPGQSADFFNTVGLSGVTVTDSNGDSVASSFQSGSGLDYGLYTVPEPSTRAVILEGLAAIFFTIASRRTKASMKE